MKQVVKEIIVSNQQHEVKNIIKRIHLEIPLNLGLIVSLVGARRSGKTYVLYDLINQLKTSGIPEHKIVFINFEDERIDFQQQGLDVILQAYTELYPDEDISGVYFFFDEIQNVNGWERFVRRLFDTKSRNIFITGSNSKLLSTEIATELRGRTISYSVYPYSFKEFLAAKNIIPDFITQKGRSKLIHVSEQFIHEGGFPELLEFNLDIKIKVLQQYFTVMIYRDIVERYKVSNPELLKYFIKKVFASVASPLSINKTYNDIKSLGYKVSNKYLYEFVEYCQSVYLTQNVKKFNYSEIKQAKSDKKVYVIDSGLLQAIDYKLSKNQGSLLENTVAMEFLKLGKQVMYFKDAYECDFIVGKNQEWEPVQVSWSLKDDETKKRELRGLEHACRYLNIKKGTIITFDEEAEFIYNGIQVQALPFYHYFGG